MSKHSVAAIVIFAAGFSTTVSAQTPQPGAAAPPAARPMRPPLFLEEPWKQIPGGGEHPVTAASVTNPNVELKLYGASSKEIQLTGSAWRREQPDARLDRHVHHAVRPSRCATRTTTWTSQGSRGSAGTSRRRASIRCGRS